jgi:hypothetical protein
MMFRFTAASVAAALIAVCPLQSAGARQTDPRVAPADNPIADARRILEAHLSHGIGASPFDSDVWHDQVNAALIVSARSGATMAELRQAAGDPPDLPARLETLRQEGFLRLDGDSVRAAFPVLIGKDRDDYFEIVARAAGAIDEQMRGSWQALVRELESRGWAGWSYHFVWSQVMDSGFTWAPMMEQRLVPPLSRLVVWVVYPAHPFKSGTNYYPDTELRDEMLAVTWRPRAANTIARAGGDWRAILPAALTGATTDEGRQRLRALGLIGEDGRVLVPVVKKSDPLYARLEGLGTEHVRLMAEHLPLHALRRLTGADGQLTFAMAYHDVSWEIVRRMVDRGVLHVPPALREGAADTVALAGVCAVVEAHPAFIAELKKALGIK